MTTLMLIRHATTAATGRRLGGRTPGVHLDDNGRAQAEAAAARLAELPVKAVYASPLERTWETAEFVARPHRLKVRPCEGVLEVEYGSWTNRPFKPLYRTKLWPVIQARPSLVGFPKGETIRQMQVRAVDAVQELTARHPRDVIALVSHADVIKAVVSFYLGQPLDLFQRLHISPASLTVLALSQHGQPALVRFNDDGPLQPQQFKPAKPDRAATRRRRRAAPAASDGAESPPRQAVTTNAAAPGDGRVEGARRAGNVEAAGG